MTNVQLQYLQKIVRKENRTHKEAVKAVADMRTQRVIV